MIDKLLSFFKQPEAENPLVSIEHAAAALMVEIMAADHSPDDSEKQAIRQALFSSTMLTEADVDIIIEEAIAAVKDSNDLFQFTDIINKNYAPEQKMQLIAFMWKVAYADSVLDKYEEHMIRKIADLIYVSHSDFIQAKIAARDAQQKD